MDARTDLIFFIGFDTGKDTTVAFTINLIKPT